MSHLRHIDQHRTAARSGLRPRIGQSGRVSNGGDSEFEALQLATFVWLARLTVEHDRPPHDPQHVELVLRSDDPEASQRLRLRFVGVRQLELKRVRPGSSCRLVVYDIRDRGWEDLNYTVSDVEGEVLSFHCEGFERLDDAAP